MRKHLLQSVFICVYLWLHFGCSADRPLNPSFPLKMADAKMVWREMEAEPKPLQRPVVVLGGIYDPGLVSGHVKGKIRKITSDDEKVISLSFFQIHSFDHCAKKVVEAVDRAFGTDDASTETIEVDVVGFSMGGLVARHAASARTGEDGSERRLRIARLFTVGTPHRGAMLAWIPMIDLIDPRVGDMRRRSTFLTQLNAQEISYPIFPYARLGDVVIGIENTAPPGRSPWWLGKPFSPSHLMAAHDVRILVDIARRLRGEQAFTTDPATEIP